MTSCLFTGSFDPFTLGHLEIVKRARKTFDKVYVAVLKNDLKATMFSVDKRIALAKAATIGMSGVEVVSHDGLAVELAKSLGAKAIVRGLRNCTDLDYEREMAYINTNLDSSIETVFLLSDSPQISSTAVRELIKLNGNLENALTKKQIEILKDFE